MLKENKKSQRPSVTEIELKNYPADEFKNTISKLNVNLVSDIQSKIRKFNDHVDNFKNYIYENYSKSGGSLKEIERYLYLYLKKNNLKNKLSEKVKSISKFEEETSELKFSPMDVPKCKRISLVDYMNNNQLLNIDEIEYHERLAEDVKDNDIDEDGKDEFLETLGEEFSHVKRPMTEDLDNLISLTSMDKKTSTVSIRKNSCGSIGESKKLYEKKLTKTDLSKAKPKFYESPLKKSNLLTSPIKRAVPKSNDKSNIIRTDSNISDGKIFISSLLNEVSDYQYTNRDDIILNIKLLQLYFSLYTLESLNKLLNHGITKESISSKRGNTRSCSPKKHDRSKGSIDTECDQVDIDAIDYAKPIERTNEIHIYDRKKSKLIKKQVPLQKKIHGCSFFLDGCRYLLHNDKLIISGGRDEYNEFNIVLQYDIRDYTLTRLADMNYPHTYHTMEFKTMIDSIVVIGGENNKTCEVYEILVGKWHRLPDLTLGRANIQLYFDKRRAHLYAFFGQIGSIIANNYSDVIEVLDFNDMETGWAKIIYNNKSDMNLSYYCGVFPLYKNQILMIGGNQGRSKLRTSSVYHLRKQELGKIDSKLLEEIRFEARKNPRLSIILAKLTSKLS
jgi:hypothetical protein